MDGTCVCALCGREIREWEYNGPVDNDLTDCGGSLHTGCWHSMARIIESLGPESAEARRVFGVHIKWDSPIVEVLLKNHLYTRAA